MGDAVVEQGRVARVGAAWKQGATAPRFWTSAHGIFAVLASVLIGAFVFVIPIGWGLDEQSHVNRAYQIGQGNLLPDLRDDGRTYGGLVPVALQDYQMLGHGWSSSADRTLGYRGRSDFQDQRKYDQRAGVPLDPTRLVSVDFTNAGASSPLVYMPAAVGFAAAQAVDATAGVASILARLLNAGAYIAIVWMGLFALRRHAMQWVVFVVALVPGALFQAGYVSADTVTNATCILFVSLLLRAFLDPTWLSSRRSLAYIATTALALTAMKPTVAALVLAVLFLPTAGFVSRRVRWWYTGSLLALVGASTAFFGLLTRDIGSAIRFQRPDADQVDSASQIAFVLGHPIEGLRVVARTVAVDGGHWLDGVAGLFGYNIVAMGSVTLVVITIAATLTVLHAERLPRRAAVGLLIAGVALSVLSIAALYVTFTPVGYERAQGVQGRYFIPALLPLIVGIAALTPVRVVMTERVVRLGTTIVMAALGVSALVIWSLYLH